MELKLHFFILSSFTSNGIDEYKFIKRLENNWYLRNFAKIVARYYK